MGKKAGLSERELRELYGNPASSELFTERERAALRFAEEVTREVEPGLETFADVKRHFASEQIVELTLLVGFWNLWNRFTESLKIDLEPHVLEEIDELGLAAAHRSMERGG